MKYIELETKLKEGSCRLSTVLNAIRTGPDSITVRRQLPPSQGKHLVNLGTFHRDGRLVMDFGRNQRSLLCDPAYLKYIVAIIPESWSLIANNRLLYHWFKVSHADKAVLIPYEPGDYFDIDASHLFAQNKNNL